MASESLPTSSPTVGPRFSEPKSNYRFDGDTAANGEPVAERMQFTGRIRIYHDAKRVQCDRRLGDAGRDRKEKELLRRLFALCGPVCREQAESKDLAHDWWLLAEELVRLALRDELFTFLHCDAGERPNGLKPVLDGTNNEAERKCAGPDSDRSCSQIKGALILTI